MINDALLKELAQGRSGEMAEIARTIQASQHAVITAPKDQVMIVQGGPGTGKTAVALHRLSWMLYRHQEELNPSDVSRDGQLHEQIWVDYYSDLEKFDDDSRLLFDTRAGRVSDPAVTFRSPKDPIDGTLWAVVHDNRGGAAWIVLPLHIR